jgi:hypothetical protein
MEENKNKFTPENSAEWLASCGFIFPRNEKELARFDLLYGGADLKMPVAAVDPFQIIRNSDLADKQAAVIPLRQQKSQNRLVAAQLKPLPAHIRQKLGKNDPDGADVAKPVIP